MKITIIDFLNFLGDNKLCHHYERVNGMDFVIVYKNTEDMMEDYRARALTIVGFDEYINEESIWFVREGRDLGSKYLKAEDVMNRCLEICEKHNPKRRLV